MTFEDDAPLFSFRSDGEVDLSESEQASDESDSD